MKFPKLFANQFKMIEKENISTRSNKVLVPIHTAIAEMFEDEFEVRSLKNKEYEFSGNYGTKKVDIALFKNGELKGAILFKAIRSEYNKNANNYAENMRGESCLFLDSGVPVYQIILIPTQIKRSNKTFEIPTEKSYLNYCHFIEATKVNPYWKNLKLGVYYIDIDYENYIGNYSNKICPNVEATLTDGLRSFKEVIING